MNIKSKFRTNNQRTMIGLIVILVMGLSACTSSSLSGEDQESGMAQISQEESGVEFTLDESSDEVRNGARLILAYDAKRNSFRGTMENTTDEVLKQVRVEVHLSNGVELGPTTPIDLEPGQIIKVSLTATSQEFDGWSAHPEVGESRGGEHQEGENEHGEEGEGEHN